VNPPALKCSAQRSECSKLATVRSSMYRQLDEATLDRFEPFGRVKDNKAEA
jgi:hypothetical protein